MPQLVPFYFINQVTFAFILLIIMIFIYINIIINYFNLNKTITKSFLALIKSFLFNKKYLSYNKYSSLDTLNLNLSVNFPFIRILIISFLRYMKPSFYFTNNYYVPLGITEGKKVSFQEKLLNKKTLSRIITIFCIGFFCKHYYQSYTGVNILVDYTNFYSILFYA